MSSSGTNEVNSESAGTACAIIVWIAAFVIFGAMAAPFFQNKFYLFDDLGGFHIPLRWFFSECMAQGDAFFWFPNLFCGFDLHGEGQVGMFHPLHLVLYGLLPFKVAFATEFLSSYLVLFVGTFFLFKRWEFRNDVASFAALVFGLSGNPIFRFSHINAVAIIAHIPWLLLTADVVLRSPNRRTAAWCSVGVALLTASQILLGYPQWVWISLAVEGFFYFFIMRRDGQWPRLISLFWAKGLGVLVGAIQLIPTWHAITLSKRNGATLEFIGTGSFSPINFVSLILPYFFRANAVRSTADIPSHEYGIYNGTIVIPLLLLLALRGVEKRWRPLALAASVLSVLGVLLALGKYTPLLRLMRLIPVVNLFRCPARYLLFYHLGTTILAAISLCQLASAKDTDRPKWRSLRWLFVLPALSLVLIVLGLVVRAARPDAWLVQQISSTPVLIINAAVICLVTGLVALTARQGRYAFVALVLIACADQAVFAISYLNRFAPEPIETMFELVPALPDSAGYRIIGGKHSVKHPGAMTKLNANAFTMSGKRLVDGYAGLMPQRVLDYTKPASLRVAGVGWVRKDKDDPLTAEEQLTDGWVQVPNPLPRVRLVTKTFVSTNPDKDITDVDIDSTAIVAEALQLSGDAPGTARTLFDRPGFIGLTTDCNSRQLLLLGESFHPGWLATLDGSDVPLMRVYGDFMGCVVPPGQHEIVFRYSAPGVRMGVIVGVVGIILIIATLVPWTGLHRV